MSLDLQPDQLEQGERGEWVQHLQERLQALGYYEGYVDGEYGQQTEDAVRRLQEASGHQQDGRVVRDTWDALAAHEQRSGINQQGYDQHGYDQHGYDQYGYDQHGYDQHSGGHDQYGGTADHYSGYDQHGGYEQQAAAAEPASASDYAGQLSPDGQYRWNGTDWEPVGQASPDGSEPVDSYAGQLSPDGRHRWNGTDWDPVHAEAAHVGDAQQSQLHPAIAGDDELREFAEFWSEQYA